MGNRPCVFLFLVFVIFSIAQNGRAQSEGSLDNPKCSGMQPSLGRALCTAGQHTVHILYIHGIGAEEAGGSWSFQKHLCAFLKGCRLPKFPVPVSRDEAQDGPFASTTPPSYKYMGSEVWTADNWRASRPFVDHYVLRRDDGGPVVIDEINWWPLVFPLKCRNIVLGEANLAGPDKELLDLCAGKSDPHRPEEQRYPWITPAQAKSAESLPSRGARFNRGVKNNLMDWGFSDPMMAVGPMRELFREAMRQLFAKSASFSAKEISRDDSSLRSQGPNADREFIVVSHSLGSFLVFSTLRDPVTASRCAALENAPLPPESDRATPVSETAEDRATCYILEHTSMLYFFANQIPLLYLATVVPPQGTGPAQAGAGADLSTQMQTLQAVRRYFGKTGIHITAFSDPSDLLSWHFPPIANTVVENCFVRNTFWHWLIASPEGAHTNYAQNKKVLRIMMDPEKYGVRSCSLSQ
jgi:hypothetical protein